MTGFEPAASSSRTKRATKLRYIPSKSQNTLYSFFVENATVFLKKIEKIFKKRQEYIYSYRFLVILLHTLSKNLVSNVVCNYISRRIT